MLVDSQQLYLLLIGKTTFDSPNGMIHIADLIYKKGGTS